MILLTGGSGLLGKELQKYIDDFYAPSHKEFDILKPKCIEEVDLIIHCAGYTDLVRAELEKEQCYKINTIGTYKLLQTYKSIPFVYISTDYCTCPVNWYSWTKLSAEELIRAHSKSYLIIRTQFKPRPFPHKKALVDQFTRGDYVDLIAPLIWSAVLKWDRKPTQWNLGTNYKSIYELAKQTRPDVKKCKVEDIKEVKLPKDYL